MKRARYPGTIITLLAIAFGAMSCAPPFPKQTLDKVDRSVPFHDLKEEPEKY